MKERWKYSDYEEEDGTPVYYKRKQRMTWQFYLRFASTWFEPCKDCQKIIDKGWDEFGWRAMIPQEIGHLAIPNMVGHALLGLCKQCRRNLFKKIENTNLIFGNKDYNPLIELQRRWIDVEEKNKNGVYESVMETVTKKEYYRVKGWKL